MPLQWLKSRPRKSSKILKRTGKPPGVFSEFAWIAGKEQLGHGQGMENKLTRMKMVLYAQLNPVKTLEQRVNDRLWLCALIYTTLAVLMFQ